MAQIPPKPNTSNLSNIETIINAQNTENKPTICIVIGMAGTGKTTLMQRINAHVHEHKIASYIINLDPAVYEVPYEPQIDIRDTVNYKNVMKQFKLGPNGGILTSLNLFATKFHDVIGLINKREQSLNYVFIDTPGQIEVFTWSASGQIITETLAATYPTMLLYVIDTVKCVDYITFMSNMTYACSILYKTKLPFLIVFNKIDVQNHEFLVKWMTDYNEFENYINNDSATARQRETYMTSLTKSLSLVLDTFYQNINSVGVSAVTGQGMKKLFEKIGVCRKEYFEEYVPMLKAKFAERQQNKQKELKKKIEKIKRETKEKEEIDQLLNKNENIIDSKQNSENSNNKNSKNNIKNRPNFEVTTIFKPNDNDGKNMIINEIDGDEIIEMSDNEDENENEINKNGNDNKNKTANNENDEEEQLLAFLNDTE